MAASGLRPGASGAKVARIASAAKAKHSPSKSESRLKDAARCSVMGKRAAAANTRRPKGVYLTAAAASSAKQARLASRPSTSAGTKPRRSTKARNTAAALGR